MTYTNSPLATDKVNFGTKNSNPRQNNTYNKSGAILKITPHHMAGKMTGKQCAEMHARGNASSANYYIGYDGDICLGVEEKRRAWTSSSPSNDYLAITIEVSNDKIGGDWHVSDASLESLIKLCVDICQRNGIQALNYTGNKNGNLTRHNMFAATACPGLYLQSKFTYIQDEVNKRLKGDQPTPAPTPMPAPTYTQKDFIKEVQKALGVPVDGIAGPQTLNATVTISKTKNNRHPAVKPIQKYLNSLGYNCGTADGIAGNKFDKALKSFQKDNGCAVDGEATAKQKTWKKLLGLA